MGCGASKPAVSKSRCQKESTPHGALLRRGQCATVVPPPSSVDRHPTPVELPKDSETTSTRNFALLFSQNTKSFTLSQIEGMQRSHGTRVSVECLRSNSAVLDNLSRVSTCSHAFDDRSNDFDGEPMAQQPSPSGEGLVEVWRN